MRLTVTGEDWGNPEISEFRVAAATGQTPPITLGSIPYRTIQQAIDAAQPGDVILLQPGRYPAGHEGLILRGKRVTLTSIDPNDSHIVAGTVIAGDGSGPAVAPPAMRTPVACWQV